MRHLAMIDSIQVTECLLSIEYGRFAVRSGSSICGSLSLALRRRATFSGRPQ